MRHQGVQAGPFFDHNESIHAVFGLEFADAVSIDCSAIFDAAIFFLYRRDVGAEQVQDGVPLARLCGNHRQNMNHRHCNSPCSVCWRKE